MTSSSLPPLRVYLSPGRVAERRWVARVVLEEHLGYRLEWAGDARAAIARHRGAGGALEVWRERLDARQWTVVETSRGAPLLLADDFLSLDPSEWLAPRSVPGSLRGQLVGGQLVGGQLAGVEQQPLPVLFGAPLPPPPRSWRSDPGAGGPWWAMAEGDSGADAMVCGADVLGAAFFQLSRYEERALAGEPGVLDDHGRFPASRSLAGANDYLERPLVDEGSDQLGLWLTRLGAAPPALGNYRLRLSHDVDHPLAGAGRGASAALRGAAGDLLAGRLASAAGRVGAWGTGLPSLDPYDTFSWLMDQAEAAGQRCAFFFMAGATAGRPDGSYRLTDPFVRRLLASVHQRGHEIGLHPSYETADDGDRLLRELEALRGVAGAEGVDLPQALGGRQHYLRWQAPLTWRLWAKAGLDYDSTLGFADAAGFRCGTCRPFTAFDLEMGEALALREIPLVAMEVTLFQYQRQSWREALATLQRLGHACRRHHGVMTLLWHNSSLGSAAARRCYRSAVEMLTP